MQGGISLGRIFGIRIQLDWSWLLIFLLIIWNLGSAFGELHPNWSSGTRWLVALVASLLFFASVLAHELAHSVMAQAQGIPVRNIILFLFGGVANIQREPHSPRAEFLITIVGPITSIVLGGLFTWLGLSLAGRGINLAMADPTAVIEQLSPLSTLLLWLGPTNIALGVFNLIPGFPLDGGRILRSILWAITDNLRRATRWASYVGQAIGWLMILGGIAMVFGVQLPFFGTGFVSGLWLIFIGWFLSSAAVQSYRQVVINDILEGVPVTTIMRRDPPVVASASSIASLVHEHVMQTDDHAFPVVDNGRLVGLVTLEDIRAVPRSQWETTQVGDIMTTYDQLTKLSTRDDASDALARLRERDVRQLPVVENGQLVGLLRRRDIVRWLQLQQDGTDGR